MKDQKKIKGTTKPLMANLDITPFLVPHSCLQGHSSASVEHKQEMAEAWTQAWERGSKKHRTFGVCNLNMYRTGVINYLLQNTCLIPRLIM